MNERVSTMRRRERKGCVWCDRIIDRKNIDKELCVSCSKFDSYQDWINSEMRKYGR